MQCCQKAVFCILINTTQKQTEGKAMALSSTGSTESLGKTYSVLSPHKKTTGQALWRKARNDIYHDKNPFKKIGLVTKPVRQHQDTWLHHLLLCSDFRGPAPWLLQHVVELAKDAHFRGGTCARGPWGGNGRRGFTTKLLLLGQVLANAAHQVTVIKSVVELQAIKKKHRMK